MNKSKMFLFLSLLWITSIVACYGFSTDMSPTNDELLITGVFNGPRYNDQPQVVEVYAANNVPDLSVYSLAFDGRKIASYTFPPRGLGPGGYVHVTQDANGYKAYFEKEIMGQRDEYYGEEVKVSGTGVIALYKEGEGKVDVYGDSDDRILQGDWNFENGWAYRKSCTRASETFNIKDWNVQSDISHTGGKYATKDTSQGDPWPEMSYEP